MDAMGASQQQNFKSSFLAPQKFLSMEQVAPTVSNSQRIPCMIYSDSECDINNVEIKKDKVMTFLIKVMYTHMNSLKNEKL